MNIANKLTFFRILLVPVFVLIMYLDFSYSNIWATIVFAVASFTDFLDGYLARRDNLVTNFGKFADPLADKILSTAALICLIEKGILPAWPIILIVSREFTITGFRIIAASENITIAASKLGKIKTASQLVSIVLILTGYEPLLKIGIPIFYFSVVFTVISGVDYLVKNKGVLDLKNI